MQLTNNQEYQKLSIWDRFSFGEGRASRKEFRCTCVVLFLMAVVLSLTLPYVFEP